MRNRWLVAFGVVFFSLDPARAQPQPPLPPPAPPASNGPTELPPLLPPPPPDAPLAEVPRPGAAPGIDYDQGYLYLPEKAPERPRRPEMCGPDGRWWASGALGLSWTPSSRLPSDVRLRLSDVLGNTAPGPVVPVTGRSIGQFEAALELVLGRWLDESHTNGLEASFFIRGTDDTFFGAAPGMLVLFPEGRGTSQAQVIVLPEPLASQIVTTFPSTLVTTFTTVDVNYRRKLFCTDNARLDALVGYRFAYLQDGLYLGGQSDGSGNNQREGYGSSRVTISSPFHGGQIGLAGEVRKNGWYASGTAKVAFGVVTPDVTATGLFAGAEGRMGSQFTALRALTAAEKSEFAVMPVVNLSIGRQVGERARVFAGYSLQYLSRAGQLHDALNPANSGLVLNDFWVQSINFGLEFRH
ncbi:Putative uncharacterized protein OS=Rhodopirellula baltica (strain SH1) GN=RB229 PE=4 SV=1: DUF1551 [Gemmata massiliana]|uniref:Uncharacterized protein n=1 Tax=Gemmata massiliana TaxID=1210884 RepID=A0A6P2CU89_9BACT|nr:BBP7 family outer membrane beta-barrel protein [Gemmata massiliana]VTR91946.1 Putative uncharacterized protein OS=Rhodopirellula baltica (strain SH1) GN=RB229 PE=4 SV=1: DUF1551 [Gemmata massiliana]